MHIELHPFKPFVPKNATTLILGSFPGKEHTQGNTSSECWFYGAKRNRFWDIISQVYETTIESKLEKQQLFTKQGIAITDILLKIQRKNDSNLDDNLEIIEFNDLAIKEILTSNKISSIFFTSRFVENHFKKRFPEISFAEYLPSPSPRFARMTLKEKVDYYKMKLPK
jgi:hypoxanthine-DNA glycosylase